MKLYTEPDEAERQELQPNIIDLINSNETKEELLLEDALRESLVDALNRQPTLIEWNIARTSFWAGVSIGGNRGSTS